MTKGCGTCTACCKILGVVELEKPVQTWCQHCAKGKGCKIYADRPTSCRGFECIWLQSQKQPEWDGVVLADNLRPDRCKVVLHTSDDGKSLVATCDSGYPGAWTEEPLHGFLRRMADKIPVIIVRHKRDRIMLGKIGASTSEKSLEKIR